MNEALMARLPSPRDLPADLWRVPVYLPYLQPKLTQRAVDAAEAKLGVKLPAAYLELLRSQNGGYLRLTSISPNLAPVDCIAGIGKRFPSILHKDWADVKAHMKDEGIRKPARIDELVPFCGDGHFYFCLDYRASGPRGEPRVTYIDVESFDTDRVVAPSFEAFLHKLRPAGVTVVIGIETTDKMATVAAAISKASKRAFEDQGDQNSGYRVFRAKLPGEASWAFLTPNRVRHGFIRKSDPDSAKLRDQLADEVERFPEHPDCTYFVSADFDTPPGRALSRAIEKLPYPSRRVRLVD